MIYISKLNEKKVSFSPPTDDDKTAKNAGLEHWTNDRMNLISRWPFIGTLAMNLEMIPVVDYRCPTACTDGKRIFFNPHFLDSLNDNERMTILAHEVWHCGLSHFSREHGKIEDHQIWNHAIDHEVNSLLDDDEFEIPENAVLYPEYKGESAEVVFEAIKSGKLSMEGECLDEHNTSGPKNDKNLQEEAGTGWDTISISEDGITAKVDSDFRPNRTDDVWKEWKKKMMAAAQQCQEMGKDLGVYKQYLDELFKSKIPWYQILLNYLTPLFDKTRKWLPPNRRHVYKRMYLPSLKKENQLKIVVAIDTSGSTSGDIVKRFVSEVFAILNSFGGYELRLIQCDYEIQEDKIFNIENPFIPDNFNLLGGGGTDFTPVFDIIAKDNDLPELLLFLTDGYGSAPDTQPPYPVIWGIIEGGRCPVNWGSQLEIDLES